MSETATTPIADGVTYPPLDRSLPQLTARAILTGMVLGGLLSLCNIYLSLRIGWSTNMSITGVLIGYALWRGFKVLFAQLKPFGILENNISQTTCSAAASISSAGLVAPIPALTLMTGRELPWILLAIWVFTVCLVGIMAAAAIRRQMILVDKLPFPSGFACPQTLKEVYGEGREALQRVGMLGVGAVVAGTIKLLGVLKLVKAIPIPGSVGGHKLGPLGFELDPSLLMVGVGALIGMRGASSMLLGSILAWGVLAPWAINNNLAELKSRETFAAMPEGVELSIAERLQFRPLRSVLEHRGVMTEAERDRYLAMSSDLAWQSAINKLALESNIANVDQSSLSWTTALAIPAVDDARLPLVIAPELAERFRIESGHLFVDGAASKGDVEALRAMNPTTDAKAPMAVFLGRIEGEARLQPVTANFTDVLEWLLWPGVTLMVVSSLVSFSFSWRSIVSTFTGSKKPPSRAAGAPSQSETSAGDAEDEPSTGDVPAKWFLAGALVTFVLSILAQLLLFDIAWWAALLGVLLSGVLAVVATRVSGETNITPIGAMGKVTQLVFGAIIPADPAANLMTANVTGGSASQCADMMHDLKTGAMLGSTPWKQIVAQIAGAVSGSLIGCAFYLILIPEPHKQLMTEEWPAPAVATWKAVAELFQRGFEALPAGSATAMLIAAIVGVILPVAERFGPKGLKSWLPSASSLGLAFVVSAMYAISIFIGALLALIVGKFFKNWTARFLVTLASGFVVGDALVGAGDAIVRVAVQYFG